MSDTRDWTADELALLDRTPLVCVAAQRPDGSLRASVVIGHVRVGDAVFVRSVRGADASWFRAVLRTGRGDLEVGDRRIRVAFEPDARRDADVDRAYPATYGDDAGVRSMVAAPARSTTLRVEPVAD